MTEFSMDEFSDLKEVGVESREPTKPEEEFFHSVYIAGKRRKNHIGVEELPGHLQIRGVEYNLNEVNMVITHVKEVLVKARHTQQRGESLECFSFKEGPPPWYGTTKLPDGSPRPCPLNSEQRALNDFCNPCRSQIIVSGLYCNEDGSPILSEEGKPVFLFIRGKGTKYNNVSSYLNDLFKMDLPPLFTPVTDETTKFEKSVVNNKRFVTNITIGTAPSNYGDKDVFVLKTGPQLHDKVVYDILKVTKKTKDKFNEKFDWSKRAGVQASGYSGKQPEGVLQFDQTDGGQQQQKEEPAKEPESKPFSFDDINF